MMDSNQFSAKVLRQNYRARLERREDDDTDSFPVPPVIVFGCIAIIIGKIGKSIHFRGS